MPAAPIYSRRKHWLVLGFLALFVAAGLVRYTAGEGDDLSSSYIGCRLLVTGHADHLYSFDPDDFAGLGDDLPWQAAADQANYEGFLHPYVQTPLWAYLLQPLCRRTRFAAFERIFAVLTLLSFAACIWLIARFWTPSLFHPVAIAVVCLALWFSQAFQYAMALMQTHVLFLLLTLAALVLAERRRPGLAGIALALAAAVKVTPAALVVYWLLTRRWKAALSMVLCSVALLVAAILATGRQLFADYLADLNRIAHVLLIAMNNQSLAAWAMARFYPRDEILHFHIFALPTPLRLASTGLMLACTVAGGLLDRRRAPGDPPLGAMFALVAATVFAPIAWTHYAIVLLAPLMVLTQLILTQLILTQRSLTQLGIHVTHRPGPAGRAVWGLALLTVLILALNFRPLATGVMESEIGRLSLVRSQFYAEILCLAALALAARLVRPGTPSAV